MIVPNSLVNLGNPEEKNDDSKILNEEDMKEGGELLRD